MTRDAAAPLDKRGQFIVARKRELFDALVGDLGGAGEEAERLYQLITATVHYEYLDELEELHDAYYYLNPALRLTRPAVDVDAAYATLTAALERVLSGANFIEVTPEELERASQETGRIRTPVRNGAADFRAIRVFRRGRHDEEIERSSWFGLRRRKVTIEIYDEVVLFAALKTELPQRRKTRKPMRAVVPGSVMTKYFHNIASADLDALYPNVRAVLTLRDAMMLVVPAIAGGIPLLLKLAPTLFVLYGLVLFYLGAGAPSSDAIGEALLVASFFIALGGFILNQWIKYERRSLRYQQEVNDTIYFHNVTNNVGLFDHLIGVAEEQEVKEALLAYFMLHAADRPLTERELDSSIEDWLQRRFSLALDFEVDDALAKLERFGILARDGDMLSVLPPAEALAALDHRWDGFFHFPAAPEQPQTRGLAV